MTIMKEYQKPEIALCDVLPESPTLTSSSFVSDRDDYEYIDLLDE